jgi:hypothetical protein
MTKKRKRKSMADENDPNPPAAQPPPEGEEKITIANQEEYEKAMEVAARSENPALYKGKVDAAYAETLAQESEKQRLEREKELEAEEAEREKRGEGTIRSPRGEQTNLTPEQAANLTAPDMGIAPGGSVGPSGPAIKK